MRAAVPFASRLANKWSELDSDAEGWLRPVLTVQVQRALDWVPIRLTSISFAVVGDFEDAVYCWRSQAQTWPATIMGIPLASGAGGHWHPPGEALHQGARSNTGPE